MQKTQLDENKKKIDKENIEKQYGSEYSMWTKELYGLFIGLDETAESASEIFAMKVAGKIGEYYHSEEKIQKLIRDNIENMGSSLKFVIKDMVENAFIHKFSGAEIVWEIKKGKVYTKKLIAFDSGECKYDREKEVFTQDMIDIPREKMIVYIRNSGKGEKIKKFQEIKRFFLQFWAKYIEGYTTPLLHGKSDNIDDMQEALENIYFKKSITTSLDSEITSIKLDNGGSKEIQQAMEYIDRLIYRMYYLGGNYVNGDKSGTVANSEVNENMFEAATSWIAEEVREVLLEEWVRRLIIYNFGIKDNWGYFALPQQGDVEKLHKLAMIMQILIEIGVITIDDYNIIREKFNLPETEIKKETIYDDDEIKKIVEKYIKTKEKENEN